jgi:hypothetical protein
LLVPYAGKLKARLLVDFRSFYDSLRGFFLTLLLLGFLSLHINLLLNLLPGPFKPFDAQAAKYLASWSRFKAVNPDFARKETSKPFS